MLPAALLSAMVAAALALAARALRRQASRRRLESWLPGPADASPAAGRDRPRRLENWLALAGYDHPNAVATFVAAAAAAVGSAALLFWLLTRSPIGRAIFESSSGLAGGLGDTVSAVLVAGPWIVFCLVAPAPILWVRASRRSLVRQVEADLPLVLELLATLAEAGLAFDASIVRLLDAAPPDRHLTRALRRFHRDVRAGMARVPALRRLAARLDVAALTVFVSAIVQAEQVGAGIAGTMRRQADDVRERRRERVAVLGQVLPVKLMFPLVICFLPGIFLSTIGPALLQMTEVIGGFLR